MGNLLAVFIAHQLANLTEKQPNLVENLEAKPLLIHGAEGMAINFAGCCCPIPGDPIVGHLKQGHGLDVHIKNCPHLLKIPKQSEKCLPV